MIKNCLNIVFLFNATQKYIHHGIPGNENNYAQILYYLSIFLLKFLDINRC